jgi:DNA-binding HxlR family transcriptional regulator
MELVLPACPVETTLLLIGDKWKVLILRDLLDGTKRFGELKKSIGRISQKVLTANLREMEACGLLTRKVYAEGGIHADRNGLQPETRPRRHEGLGHGIQGSRNAS